MRENCARTCGFCVVGEDDEKRGGNEKKKGGDGIVPQEGGKSVISGKPVVVERKNFLQKWQNIQFRSTHPAQTDCAGMHGQGQQLFHKCPPVWKPTIRGIYGKFKSLKNQKLLEDKILHKNLS